MIRSRTAVAILISICLLGCSKRDADTPLKAPESVQTATSDSVPVATPETVTFKLVAGVVRRTGDVIPIARSTFKFAPSSLEAIRAELEARPGLPPKPANPKRKCLDCQLDCGTTARSLDAFKNCRSACGDCLGADITALEKKYQQEIEAWNGLAWAGADKVAAAANPRGLKPLEVVTDLGGEVQVTLDVGRWYVSGTATVGDSLIIWKDVPVDVRSGMEKFELSNDNGEII